MGVMQEVYDFSKVITFQHGPHYRPIPIRVPIDSPHFGTGNLGQILRGNFSGKGPLKRSGFMGAMPFGCLGFWV